MTGFDMAITDTKVIGDYTAAITIDGATHFLLIQPGSSSTAYKKISRNVLLGITGAPVGTSDSQSITNKTLDNTNTITLKDTLFTLQDDGDTSKQAKFQLSGITTATTRTYTLPNASSTLADIATAQTFTNKTLTSPVITGGTIDNSTITIDSIAGHTTPTSGTIFGLSISSSKVGTNGVVTASITDSAVTSPKAATGFCVQQVSSNFGTVANGSTAIPADNTIPQNTEGDEYMTLAITPKSATNILVIQTVFHGSCTSATDVSCALFQDTTVNALAGTYQFQATATGLLVLTLTYRMVAGTTSSTTFKIRAGGTTGTTTFNGQSSAQRFGGITQSSMVISEIKA